MSERILLGDQIIRKALADRLSKCPEVTKYDVGDEREAGVLAHAFGDLEESFNAFLDHQLPRLMNDEASPLICDPASGKTYVGQSGDIARRIGEHLVSGKLLPEGLDAVRTTEVLGGKTAREIAEQLRINELGGIKNLENVRNAIGKAREYLLLGVPY